MNLIHITREKLCAKFLDESGTLAPWLLMSVAVMARTSARITPSLSGVVQPVRIGFIPLADCAPLLVARELDIFRKHGVRVELSCEVGWATIREKLLYNQIDAAHAIAGLALAMRMGLSTSPSRVVAPFIFNLHGNAITLSRDLWNRGVRDAVTLKKLIRSSRSRRFTFAMVSRYSSHFFLLRRWLTEGGIHLEREVRLVVLPPTQMATNLAANLIDGYCVGEPWNSTAVENGTGWIAATSEQLAPNHPEKVLLMNESFIVQYADQALAITEALRESCAFCDPMENRPEVVRVLTNSGHFNGFEKALSRSLIGPFDLGTGSTIDAANFHIFQRRNANEPLNERGTWLLNEFITHGLIQPGQRAEATEALSACWTAEPLRSAPASPALPSTQTTVPKTKKLATPATV